MIARILAIISPLLDKETFFSVLSQLLNEISVSSDQHYGSIYAVGYILSRNKQLKRDIPNEMVVKALFALFKVTFFILFSPN